MTENKITIPIWKKSNLTVEEAAAYCGIGSRKLRELSDSEFCPFVLWNGSKRLIKRRKLDEYLDNAYSVKLSGVLTPVLLRMDPIYCFCRITDIRIAALPDPCTQYGKNNVPGICGRKSFFTYNRYNPDICI